LLFVTLDVVTLGADIIAADKVVAYIAVADIVFC